jgi:hypothetical protein
MRANSEEIAHRLATVRQISPYLDTAQAAYYLGLTANRLERMRGTDEGPPFREHGRFIRYHIDDLDAWSKAHEKKTRRKIVNDAG